MHRLGCPASRETLEQACDVHGTDVDDLVEKLNAHFGNEPCVMRPPGGGGGPGAPGHRAADIGCDH